MTGRKPTGVCVFPSPSGKDTPPANGEEEKNAELWTGDSYLTESQYLGELRWHYRRHEEGGWVGMGESREKSHGAFGEVGEHGRRQRRPRTVCFRRPAGVYRRKPKGLPIL